MTEQQLLEQSLAVTQQAVDGQQQIIATYKRAHVEATEAHRRAQQALAENSDPSDDIIDRLTRESAKASALMVQARHRLDGALVDLEPMQVALTEAQAAFDAYLHEQSVTKLARSIVETRDRLRSTLVDAGNLLDALRLAAVESAQAQRIPPARVNYLWLLHTCNALEGLDLATLHAVTTAAPLPALAFGIYSETPETGRNEHALHPTECIELALAGKNPAKVFIDRMNQKQADAQAAAAVSYDQRIAELDAKIGPEVAELPAADRIEIMTYRVLRRLQSGEDLTPTERAWKNTPELKGLRADQMMVSSWYSDDAVRLDRLIELRDQEVRVQLARRAS